jgi:hypothetical protein
MWKKDICPTDMGRMTRMTFGQTFGRKMEIDHLKERHLVNRHLKERHLDSRHVEERHLANRRLAARHLAADI